MIEYQINEINLLSLAINIPPPDLNKIDSMFTFMVSINQKVDEKNELLVPFITVKIFEKGKDFILAEGMFGVSFRINNFKKVLKKNSSGIYKIPVSLSAATNNITISTVRGSLYERLRGTYIEKAILPLITHDDLTQAKKM